MTRTIRLSFAAAAMFCTSQATAETTYFTQRAAFLEAAGQVGLGSFEDLLVCHTLECRGQVILQPDFRLDLIGRPADEMYVDDDAQFGLTPTEGYNYIYVSIAAGNRLRFLFNEPTNVFAVAISDYGDFLPGTGTLDFSNDAGDQTVIAGGQPSGTINFFGVVNPDETFEIVDLVSNSSGEAFGLDEVYYTGDPPPDGPSYEQDYVAQLELHAGTLPPLQASGEFETLVFPPKGSFSFPSGTLSNAPSSSTSVAGGILESASMSTTNRRGTLDRNGGVMQLDGQMTIRFSLPPFDDFGELSVPLRGAGVGVDSTITSFRYGDVWAFRVMGAEWQVEPAMVQSVIYTTPLETTTFTGGDSRTSMGGGGVLRLIAPMRVLALRTSPMRSTASVEVPLTALLSIPEPGLLALQLSAAAILLAMGRVRHKKK